MSSQPERCAKCGSEKIKHETLSMSGKDGSFGGRGYRFDVYICEKCGYSEFYYKSKSLWI